MKAFMKDDNTLIINTMIEPNEKEQFITFIKNIENKTLNIQETYDTEGEISGLMIKLS